MRLNCIPHAEQISNNRTAPKRVVPSRIAAEPQRVSRSSPNLRNEEVNGTRRADGRGGGRGTGRGPPQGQRNADNRSRPQPRDTERAAPQPKYDMLVVVEGINDMKAVRRAVNADVYVLGTATKANNADVLDALNSLGGQYKGIVLLLDPDVAGRQARNMLNTSLPGCWHAFIPVPVAQATKAAGWKEIGNIGVEHAGPAAIKAALLGRRQGVQGRQEFTREDLVDLGLIAVMHERGGNVTERRNLVCDYLGLGMCDGKQLLRQLNSYGFTKSDLKGALAWSEPQLALKPTNEEN